MKMHWIFISVVGLAVLATVEPTKHHFVYTSELASLSLNNSQLTEMFLLTERLQTFSIKFLQNVVAESPRDNVLFSPNSVYTSFLMLCFLHNNLRKHWKINQFLDIPLDQDRASLLQLYSVGRRFGNMKIINPETNSEIGIVNRMFVSANMGLDILASKILKKDLQIMDFRASLSLSREYINDWATAETRGFIKNLVPEQKIKENTMIVLANAAYFKAQWHYTFSPGYTTEKEFYLAPLKIVYVPMMSQIGKFRHMNMYEWDIHALELPYDDDSHSMYIVLPMFIEPRGISRIIEEVDDKFLRDVVLSPEWNVETIKVSLPKFNIEKYTDTLENILFGRGANNTSNVHVIHKSQLSVNEAGKIYSDEIEETEDESELDGVKQFNCDRPFMYFVFNKHYGTVVFMGTYQTPISA